MMFVPPVVQPWPVVLPLVNVFYPAYQKQMPQMSGTGGLLTVSSMFDAACHMARVGSDQPMSSFIDAALYNSASFRLWRQAMPSRTPLSLLAYQRKNLLTGQNSLNSAIASSNALLSAGQELIHGGKLSSNLGVLTTSRPLSTTFCPEVAMRNAEWRGKAYHDGELNLNVIKVATSKTNAFSFRIRGTKFCHEKEVLFASGAKLTFKSKICVNNSYTVSAWVGGRMLSKNVPVYVWNVDLE